VGGSVSQGFALGSGHDLGVPGSSPVSGSPPSRESASPSALHPARALALSLSQIIKILKKKKKRK